MKRALLLAAMLLTGLLAACGGTPDKVAAKSCEGLLKPADPAATLPVGIPALDGQVLYGPSTQGKTHIVFGRVAGDFVPVRDQLVVKLEAAGWTIDGTDQETVEAEAQFSRQPPLQAGSVKVEPLCEGTVEIRYRLSE